MTPSLGKLLCSLALDRGARSVETAVDRLGDLSRILNYARGCLEFEARPDDVFIVTYPRSGTTLMQFLLHLLTSERPEDFDHISQVVPWFERSLASGALTAADLEAMPSPRIFKSHLAYCWVPKGGRSIYVTREGRDVAVSYYHFYRSHLRFEGTFEQFFERFLRGDVQYRSWFKHTAGWHAHRGEPGILFLSFEDLVDAMPSCVDEIVRFCELAVTEDRVAETIEKCRFDYMKQREDKFDFTTELLLQRGYELRSFLRGGRTGEGKERLSPLQEAAFARESARMHRYPDLEVDLPQFLL